MIRGKVVTMHGIIAERMPSDRFGVLTDDGQMILAGPSGRLSRDAYQFGTGDRVVVEFNLDRTLPGRIVRCEPAQRT